MGKKAAVKEQEKQQAPAIVEEEEPPVAAEREGPPSGKSKKDLIAAKKKEKSGRNNDALDLMEQEQREAAKQRIVDRLLRMLLVGFVLDAMKGKEESANGNGAREVKVGKKKGLSSGREEESEGFSVKSLRQKADTYGGPMLMLAFTVALFAVRAAEEGYAPAGADEYQFNYYEALGASSSDDMMGIKKAYKASSLKNHPDKNPDCAECAETFAKISKAYETLGNVEKRQAYDSGRRAKGAIESMSSEELTPENFESKVLRSNEVWFVQAYDPSDSKCKSFSAQWEDFADSSKEVAKFGRVDVTQPGMKDLLPMRVPLLPVVFRYVRGQSPDYFMWNGDEDRGGKALRRFMESSYPTLSRFDAASEVASWWKADDQPRILVIGPSTTSHAAKPSDVMPVWRLSHVWAEFFSFSSAEKVVAAEGLGPEVDLSKGTMWAVVSRLGGPGSPVMTTETKSIQGVLTAIEEILAEGIREQAPIATLRNYEQLCGATALGGDHFKSRYCLVLVDSSSSDAAKSVAELKASREAYSNEVQEMINSGSDPEDPFSIQPVRVKTSGSRLPWNSAGAGNSFHAAWAEASKARAFVIEMETRRIGGVKTPSLKELFQNIAYEDLKVQDLSSDGLVLSRLFPDPETSLRRELSALLSSSFGALLAYLLVACAVAVLPELPLPATGALLAIVAVVLTITWPAMGRRFIGFFWCTAFPSRMQCQVNV
mmetsp:Transcript_60630/g.109256  ORF Transcript_60630/g.109256 Transcript_60630/m.109256 type:complete len:713 (-) Transcript_60630:122-2260(-)